MSDLYKARCLCGQLTFLLQLPPVAAFRAHGNAVELVAVADATDGNEATISYAPLEGCAFRLFLLSSVTDFFDMMAK